MGQKGRGASQSSAEGRRSDAADRNPCPTHRQKILTRKIADRKIDLSSDFNQEITGLVFAKRQARRNDGGRAVLSDDRRTA